MTRSASTQAGIEWSASPKESNHQLSHRPSAAFPGRTENMIVQIRSTSYGLRCYSNENVGVDLPDVTNSILMTLDTRMRNRNRRTWMRATNVPVPSWASSTSTTSPPPTELKRMASPGLSGERAGKRRNKLCKRTLFDVNMHARRTEMMVASLRGQQARKRATTRASKSASLPCEDGPLRIAQ